MSKIVWFIAQPVENLCVYPTMSKWTLSTHKCHGMLFITNYALIISLPSTSFFPLKHQCMSSLNSKT